MSLDDFHGFPFHIFGGDGWEAGVRGSGSMGSSTTVNPSQESTVWTGSQFYSVCMWRFIFHRESRSWLFTPRTRAALVVPGTIRIPPRISVTRTADLETFPISPCSRTRVLTQNISRAATLLNARLQLVFRSPFTQSGVLLKKHLTVVQRTVPASK